MITLLAFDWANTVITPIFGFLFGGGLVAAYNALYKVKPEAGQIVVSAAQGALIVQTGVIENLKKEIERLGNEIAELKSELQTRDKLIMQLQQQIMSMQGSQDRHDKEIKGLSNGGSQNNH